MASTKGTPRMSAEERLEQILDVAVRLIGEKGYNGFSLQDVASEIGVSQTAVIHRILNKQNLLMLVLERYYDNSGAANDYLKQFQPGGARESDKPRIPEVMQVVVDQNSKQPELVRLFEMLNTEAMSPDHPAHNYFVQRTVNISEQYYDTDWLVPDGVDGHLVYMLAYAAMYGLEGRWLANPEIDYPAEWQRYADYLFPSPTWDGYR
ncbi:TetR/AcrR family transcriptional regulator [Bifidobacterium callimiconis]|uniref:TetR family transcriptional regulator n=1 Tax=Bifidobacterium callimiconis TaxID=2306973 RepID=A0A430FBF5_9BIFI|nr:TetR/AcrR family transcriptional regulator [Bifidobacterium callimiconis]RSX50167.1 TetR family transcriptional regulator [Bifidobacterium callimiconis]